MKKIYRLCTQCTPHHIENCENCFGFGVYSLKHGDCVYAMDAGLTIRKVIKCPECGSDENGAPVDWEKLNK